MSPKFNSLSALKAGALALAMFAGAAQKAEAAVTVFTDFGLWSAAAGPFVTETFAGNVLNTPGLSFTTANGSIGSERFNDQINEATTPPGTTWSFGGNIKAFGGDWNLAGPGGQGTGITLTLIDATNVSTVVGTEIPRSIAGSFFGIVSTDAFIRIQLTEGTQASGVETYNVDNLRIGSAVPEPSTWAMMLIGFAGLAFAARRKDRFAAA